MAELISTSATPPDTTDDDPRIGHLLADDTTPPSALSAALIGFPVDEGVVRNGGRAGAAEGPARLRARLYGMTPDARRGRAFHDLLGATADLGNLEGDAPLQDLQADLGEAVAPYLESEGVPIVLGGGHETAYGHFLAYERISREVSILNWDAHADVRPLKNGRPHSGSSFRQALEHPSGCCRSYAVAGLQPHSTAASHLQFLDTQGGKYWWANELTISVVDDVYDALTHPTMVTFDLDAVDQSQAPGVSAPAVAGLDREIWLHAAYRAGRSTQVTSIDIVELNPRVDIDDRTARLAALTVFRILCGLTDRVQSE